MLVIGAGSAGIAFARRARQHLPKAKIILVDRNAFNSHVGGACVNRGCVPKKLFWTEAKHAMTLKDSSYMKYFDNISKNIPAIFNWTRFKTDLGKYLIELRARYIEGLKRDSIEMVAGEVIKVVCDEDEGVLVTIRQQSAKTIKCEHLVIATGSIPAIPASVPGAIDYGITSDNIFDDLESGPGESMAIIGSGYIAVEMSGILKALGTKVELFIRSPALLNAFDTMVQEEVTRVLGQKGIVIHPCTDVTEIVKKEQGFMVNVNTPKNEPGCGSSANQHLLYGPFDRIMWAIGRDGQVNFKHPLDLTPDQRFLATEDTNDQGVSLWRCLLKGTPLSRIHAIGDVTGKHMLTPHAIAVGRRLADDLYASKPIMSPLKVIPSVLFTDPPIGTCGMTEKDAVNKYGAIRVKVYQTRFKPLSIALHDDHFENDVIAESLLTCQYKLICLVCDEHAFNEQIIGIHIVGPGSDEALQGFAVAMQMGMTRGNLLSTCAIHPIVIEELLTIKERS